MGEQVVRLFGACASGGVGGHRRTARPCVERGLHGPPAGLDVVGALEQRGIADHRVINQRLVPGARLAPEIVLVEDPS